jgi:tetraprenyl-beta-curcumene synthase
MSSPVLYRTRQRAVLAAGFVVAARRYWVGLYPTIRDEIRFMKSRAAEIPDPALRRLALATQDSKWGNLEGAAAFATFVPEKHRAAIARLLVGLQSIYDYADTLTEQPSADRSANAIMLHSAMLAALQPDLQLADYYAHHTSGDDGGYLACLIRRCRGVIERLPTYPIVMEGALTNTQRIIDYQARINLDPEHDYRSFVRWATEETPNGTDLYWWETGAACGSSLAIFALLTAAASPTLTHGRAQAIEATYWPWADALHTLLDNFIDRAEDTATDQHNLLNHYASQQEMTERLRLLASETIRRARQIGPHHRLILAGMVALYLSDEQAWITPARATTESILQATGALATPSMLLIRIRRLALRA